MSGPQAPRRNSAPQAPRAEDEDAALFRAEMRGVLPSPAPNRVEPFRERRAPVPVQRLEDERAVLAELAQALDGDEAEIEEDTAFLRPGLPRDILRKLRRTHWVIQDHLDLHGHSAEEAAEATAEFLAEARRGGLRCVRIVHGKGLGSRGRQPVLKGRIRRLLMRRGDVLAFVEPRAAQGGAGAVVVLLDA